jgi:DNA polymerase-3 subunit delta'
MDFKSVVGQAAVKRLLIRTADRGQLPNGFLFCGAEGVGKWAAALALAAYLNCRQRADGDSCGVCPPCIQTAKLQYPNLHIAVPTPPSKSRDEENANYWTILNEKITEPYALITGERQMTIPVDTVYGIRENLSRKVSVIGRRVVIIEQMDRMLTSSADAMLKLIEEPPPETLIIVTTSRPERLLPTIISRCREVRFAYLHDDDIRDYLIRRAATTEKTAALLARIAGGSIGRALYLASEENQQDREVAKMIFKGIFLTDAADVAAEAVDLMPYRDRFRVNRMVRVWQTLFRDLIVLRGGGGQEALINIDFAGELEKLAGRVTSEENLLTIPSYLGTVIDDIDLNVDTRAAVGAMLIEVIRRFSHT